MPVALITQTQYARQRGVAKSAVSRAVREGRISLIGGLIDPAVADIQWSNNTRARADSGRSAAGPQGGNVAAPKLGSMTEYAAARSDDQTAVEQAAQEGHIAKRGLEYYQDRGRRERIEADLAELELLQKRGELYSKQDVDQLLERMVGQIRPSFLQMPGRLAPILAAETDSSIVMAILDREVRALLASAAGEG